MSIHSQLKRLQDIMRLPPSNELIEEVERICSQENACKLFWCERLENPQWFSLMTERNWFANPPNTRIEAGIVVHPSWIESIILLNFVKIIPTEIAKTLAAVPDTDNARVGDQIIRIAASLENPSDIHLVRRRIGSIIADRTRSARVWLIDLLRDWLAAGAVQDVIELLPQVFAFDAADKDSAAGSTDAWELSQIDEQVLVPLTASHGKQILPVLSSALEKLCKGDAKDELALTTLWLEDFSSNPGFGHQKETILILRVYASCRELINHEKEEGADWVDELLRKQEWALFQRLRWQLYSDFPEHFVNQARNEVLQRMPQMSRIQHGFEFHRMITTFVDRYSYQFLSREQISQIIEAISNGPLDKDGNIDVDEKYVARFRAKQIQAFRPLLEDKQLFTVRTAEGEEVVFQPEHYKPIQFTAEAHTIEQRSPITADRLAKLPDGELWMLLNDWIPDRNRQNDKWWIEEGVDGLANAFAEAVEQDQSRFSGQSEWWKQLKRPAFFWRILDRALTSEQASQPNEDVWAVWFGLSEFVVAQHPIEKPDEKGAVDDTSATNPTWKYARWSVARLVERMLKHQHGPPLDYSERIALLLQRLATEQDPRLDENEKSLSSSSFDWLGKGINSTAGTAIEGLLSYPLWQKKHAPNAAPSSWVTDVLFQQLTRETQSPAVFAVLGSQLPLLVHLFPEWCKEHRETILPFQRQPIHAEAALVSHLAYNNPNGLIIAAFPNLLDQALSLLDFGQQRDNQPMPLKELPARLGYHIAYYYWNALPDETVAERQLDRFFAVASAATRGRLIAQIGQVFGRATSSTDQLIKRVQMLWDKRSMTIASEVNRDPGLLDQFIPELESFAYWVDDNCFESSWRLIRLAESLELIKKSPGVSELVKTLEKLSDDPNNLQSVMRCVQLLTEKFSDPLKWSMREGDLKETIKRGLEASDSRTREMADSARNNLLKHGLFAYQEI